MNGPASYRESGPAPSDAAAPFLGHLRGGPSAPRWPAWGHASLLIARQGPSCPHPLRTPNDRIASQSLSGGLGRLRAVAAGVPVVGEEVEALGEETSCADAFGDHRSTWTPAEAPPALTAGANHPSARLAALPRDHVLVTSAAEEVHAQWPGIARWSPAPPGGIGGLRQDGKGEIAAAHGITAILTGPDP